MYRLKRRQSGEVGRRRGKDVEDQEAEQQRWDPSSQPPWSDAHLKRERRGCSTRGPQRRPQMSSRGRGRSRRPTTAVSPWPTTTITNRTGQYERGARANLVRRLGARPAQLAVHGSDRRGLTTGRTKPAPTQPVCCVSGAGKS